MPGFDAQITFCYTPDLAGTARFFRDPNGYLIEIQRFEDPRWTKEERP